MTERPLAKPVDKLTVSDLTRFPVWEYAIDDEEAYPDETYVRPVTDLPVDSLLNRVVGIQVQLHNGQLCWALLSNIDLDDQQTTDRCLFISIEINDAWIFMVTEFDSAYEKYGPEALSAILHLPVEEVFPIHYDIGSLVKNANIKTVGEIPFKHPVE